MSLWGELNGTDFNQFAPSWVSEPNGRGTWNIIYSCCLTLSFCVFTAIHLNVGPANETNAQWWFRKGKWVLIAIVAPEIMLYTAGKQWFSASRLSKKMKQFSGSKQISEPVDPTTPISAPFWSRAETPSKAVPLQRPWGVNFGLIYGFFVTMGGFVADVSHLHNTISRLTISPKGIAFLARHGHFIKIRDAVIKDKSKADTLAKGFVCIQVLWMLAQTIGRRAAGYPITLLEVHTLVHVGCAITMYGLWFQKPLDVRDPVWIDVSECEDLIALMLVRNFGFGGRVQTHEHGPTVPVKSVEHQFSNGSEAAYLHLYPSSEKEQPPNEDIRETQQTTMQSLSSENFNMQRRAPHFSLAATPKIVTHHHLVGYDYSLGVPSHGPAICSLNSGQALECGVGPAPSVRPLWGTHDEEQYGGHLQIALTSRDVRRWTLAAQASRRIGEDIYRDSVQGSVNYFTDYTTNIFLDHKGVQAGFYAYFCSWASGGLIAALVICTFYGAAHATAWAFVFPTSMERILWRIACIDSIAGVISLLAVFSIGVYLHEHGRRLLVSSFFTKEPGIMPLLYRATVVVGIINFPMFVASRIYIIVETFISLRHVEIGVYQTVQWTDYIPHF